MHTIIKNIGHEPSTSHFIYWIYGLFVMDYKKNDFDIQ